MTQRDSRGEYEARMHRVLEHIDRHLDQSLDLAALAGVAYFSPFHFHRLFAAWMGETLGDYLRRRRVEVAALRLLSQPRLSILEAALSVGFGSGEAFNRAFRARFGAAPSAWRRHAGANRNLDQALRNPGQALSAARGEHEVPRLKELIMNVKLIDRRDAAIAYQRHTGPYGKPVGDFWQNSVYPWLVANDLLAQPRYGLSHDDPSITAPEQCRYDACVELPEGFEAPAGMLRTTIPGGRYASLAFEGTSLTIAAAWQAILRDWLPQSGMQLDARPAFEYYPTDARYDPTTGTFSCDICIPVTPL